MPVKLPTLERSTQVVGPVSSGQIKGQSVDVASSQARVSSAIVKGADKILGIYEKTQREAYDSRIAELGHQLDRFGREKLEGTPNNPESGLRHLRGNPDEAYGKFDTELGQKRDSLLSGSGLDGKHLERAKGILNRRYNNLYNTSLNYYGVQNARYKTELADATVEIANRDAYTALADYDPKNEKTLEPFKQAVDEIADARLKEARANGQALEVPANAKGTKYRVLEDDGTSTYLTLDSRAREKVLGDISKTTYNSINGMVKSGRIDAARELIKLYGDQIDPVHKAKLDESFEKKDIEVQSYRTLGKLDHLTYKERAEKLKKLPSKTAKQAEIKHESMKLNDADNRMMENQKKRASTDVYNQIAIQLEKATDPNRAGEDVVDTVPGMLNHIVNVGGATGPVKDFLPDITEASQQKALLKTVEERPKGGDDTAYGEIMNMIDTGQLHNLSFPDLQHKGANLNKTQWTSVQSAWKKTRETDGDTRARNSKGRTMMMRNAKNMGLLKTKRGSSELNTKSKKIAIELEDTYWQQSDNVPKGTSQEEIFRNVRQIVIDKKREEDAKSGGFFSNFFGTSSDDTPAPSKPRVKAPPSKFDGLKADERLKVMNEFKKANGRSASSKAELIEFYEKSLSNVSE